MHGPWHADQPRRENTAEAAASWVRNVLAQKLQTLLQHKSSLDRYFARKPGAAEIADDLAALGSSVATDVRTTYRILCLKRAEHEADADFRAVLYWLRKLTNCTKANCRALSSSRSKKPELINGRAHFVYANMWHTWWGQRGQRSRDESTNPGLHTSSLRLLPYVAACSLSSQAMALCCRASARPRAIGRNTEDTGAASQSAGGSARGTALAFRSGLRG